MSVLVTSKYSSSCCVYKDPSLHPVLGLLCTLQPAFVPVQQNMFTLNGSSFLKHWISSERKEVFDQLDGYYFRGGYYLDVVRVLFGVDLIVVEDAVIIETSSHVPDSQEKGFVRRKRPVKILLILFLIKYLLAGGSLQKRGKCLSRLGAPDGELRSIDSDYQAHQKRQSLQISGFPSMYKATLLMVANASIDGHGSSSNDMDNGSDADENEDDLGTQIAEEVVALKRSKVEKQFGRYTHRLTPVFGTCVANLPEFHSSCRRTVTAYCAQENTDSGSLWDRKARIQIR
ncbi:hypothetical protein BDR07DRAFT_1374256 [Suillus spraguei]|nr:hypothetical protein BDR07DRAFT_1374256 [Suillus spraguei]